MRFYTSAAAHDVSRMVTVRGEGVQSHPQNTQQRMLKSGKRGRQLSSAKWAGPELEADQNHPENTQQRMLKSGKRGRRLSSKWAGPEGF